MNPNDLRAVLSMAESPKRAAQMTPQQRLEVVQGYLEGLGTGAPMLFPVTRGRGNDMQTIGASVIDGDRLISHALQSGGDEGRQLLFVPGANPAPITHIAEQGNLADGGQIYYGTMPTDKARAVYRQAVNQGYVPAKDNALQEEFLYGSEVINAPGPAITDLYRAISQGQPQSPQQEAPMYALPMKFAYGASAIPGTEPTTFDAILAGQRTSTLRKIGQIPEYVQPGSLVTVYDDRGRRQVVEVTGRRIVNPSMVDELSQTERWTPEFLANYINRVGGGRLEQLLYRMPNGRQ